jgi:hypothetical protein
MGIFDKGGSAPAPPNPYLTAQAQTGTNIDTAIANTALGQVNQVTPQGTLTYDKTGSTTVGGRKIPQFTATTEMSPQMQAIWDRNMAGQKNLAGLAEQQSGLLSGHMNDLFQLDDVQLDRPDLQGSVDSRNMRTTLDPRGEVLDRFDGGGDITRTYGANDFSADRQRVEGALMDRINPYLEQDRESLRTQLINQGFQEGDEGYNRAMDRFERNVNDTRMGAILNAGQEQQRMTDMEAQRAGFQNAAQMQAYGQNQGQAAFANQAQATRFGQDMADTGFFNTAQQQQYAQDMMGRQFDNQVGQQNLTNDMTLQNWQDSRALQNRNQPINETTALLSGSQVSPPQFATMQPTQMPTTDIAGIINDSYSNQLNAYNQQQQQSNGLFGDILSAGASLISPIKF